MAAGLLDYQREFWNTGKESAIKALTLNQFVSLFPHSPHDPSRLSRLVRTITLQNHDGTSVCLRKLFITNRRVLAHTIKEIIAQYDNLRTDKDIQTILREVHGIFLSVRTICNCRKLLNILRYKERAAHYYGRDIAFSDYVKLSERIPSGSETKFNGIPAEPGVYELSIPAKLEYERHKSDIIYIGSSRDLRKRIASYSGNGVKNGQLSQFLKKHEVFVRFCRTEHYRALEKELLKNFKNNYGELPKANILGG